MMLFFVAQIYKFSVDRHTRCQRFGCYFSGYKEKMGSTKKLSTRKSQLLQSSLNCSLIFIPND